LSFAQQQCSDRKWLRVGLQTLVSRHSEQGLWQEQGDQIGRIFANWAIIFFGHFTENYRSSANSTGTFYHTASYVLIWTKNGLERLFHKLIWSPWTRALHLFSLYILVLYTNQVSKDLVRAR
jgi:hypothetical protein